MTRPLVTSVAALAAFTNFAFAEEAEGPFTAEFSFEIQTDSVFDSDDKDAEITDTYATVEAELSYDFGAGIGIHSALVFEPVLDAEGDRTFEDHGLYVSELYMTFAMGDAELTVGKFGPAFGDAWDSAPGLYGADFAGDYEISEKLGVGLTIPLAMGGGEHELSFAAFAADRSALSDSLFTERGELTLADGGVSNTDSLESFALSLAGEFGATGYNFGLQSQAKGQGDTDDQVGVVFGVSQAFEAAALPVELMAEVAYFDSFDGGPDSATFFTLGAELPVTDQLTIGLAASWRDIENGDSDTLATVSAEYAFTDTVSGALGYRYGDEGGVESHGIGAVVSLAF